MSSTDGVRGARDFCLLQSIQTGSGAHLASYPMGTWALSLGAKRPGRETDYSPPVSAEVENDLHGVALN
jgi:hypothetical protein